MGTAICMNLLLLREHSLLEAIGVDCLCADISLEAGRLRRFAGDSLCRPRLPDPIDSFLAVKHSPGLFCDLRCEGLEAI